MYTVYVRTNTVNEMKYVGQTGDFIDRNRKWNCLKVRYANRFLTEDRLKYGLECFTTQILAEVETEEESLELEKYYIKAFNTIYPNGYNKSVGGKNNCGAPKGENNPNYGKHFTEEHKRKMSEAKKGKTTWIKGKHHTEETKQKISEAKSKPVLQINKDTGEVIKKWPSTREVQRQLGYVQTSISKCCLGKLKQSYGFKWKYA